MDKVILLNRSGGYLLHPMYSSFRTQSSARKRSRRVIRFLRSHSAGEEIFGFIGLLGLRGDDPTIP